MTDEIIVEEESTLPPKRRDSGQDIGNPIPAQITVNEYKGTKSDADSWRRTKNTRYLKKRARQSINKGDTDKSLATILRTRRG